MLQMPDFTELRAAVETAISELGGKVAPKFTWSSPHDATWVSGSHSLACGSADEVTHLLIIYQGHRTNLTRATPVYVSVMHGEVYKYSGESML